MKKSFGSPDERRTPDKTEVEVVDLGSVKAARMTLQPGWRWSECIKPLANTESCQIHHEGMLAAGQMHVRHDDGTEIHIGPGDACVIEPGHDAWVIGSGAVVGYEFDSKAPRRSRPADRRAALGGRADLPGPSSPDRGAAGAGAGWWVEPPPVRGSVLGS